MRTLRRTHDDSDYQRLNPLAIREAVECLELPGLLKRPVAGCPHLVTLLSEIAHYERGAGFS